MRGELETLSRGVGDVWRFETPAPYVSHLHAPLPLPDGGFVILAGDASAETCARLKDWYGPQVRIVGCPPRQVLALIERHFRSALEHLAVCDLLEHEPQFSASKVVTPDQCVTLCMTAVTIALLVAWQPHIMATVLTVVLGLLFVANAAFRGVLLCASSPQVPDTDSMQATDAGLPVYSILVPLYREAAIVPALVKSLRALDYPQERLDIKLIVEADDDDTARVADAAAIDPCFTVVRVPPGQPRTKPRACNYALPLALGEFTVIFDAEDRPEPDQLRKAVAAFRRAPAHVACLQARLNFYNANENWLTRLFALDYALWFDYLLPGLDRLGIPMPLGGTSNHFRTAALRAIHGWDPYNVTEDADLGIRFARLGQRVRVLDSTTYEEATSRLDPWLRQRSRWLKGYMQTWLVHMRSSRALLRHAGVGGFIGFQLFVAGTFLSALLNPLLWAAFLFSQFHGSSAPGTEQGISHATLLSLTLGNTLFACFAVLSPLRRGWLELAPYGLTAPFYWLLISCAGLRALVQLCLRPWYWDKTPHGLSRTPSGAAT
ncbi:MAG: glycosyltransferase [Rhizomicrobium sp.]